MTSILDSPGQSHGRGPSKMIGQFGKEIRFSAGGNLNKRCLDIVELKAWF
jgi:hypothetical protein